MVKVVTVLLLLALTAAAAALLVYVDYKHPALLARKLPEAESVLVKKSERKLYLIRDGRPYRSYRVALGANPIGHKQQQGDKRTPEGDYLIDWRNPGSAFHLSLHISYPNEQDKQSAAARGVSPGGLIMIHGQPNRAGWYQRLFQRKDWTLGCIAVSNREMEEIWRAVPDGTPIRIEP